jgi:hypothetical protein
VAQEEEELEKEAMKEYSSEGGEDVSFVLFVMLSRRRQETDGRRNRGNHEFPVERGLYLIQKSI